ncbi:integrase [Collimonas humicola]|uniref:integrase n=1 Tax=Collimonas humicola TaxID=2825886 RepID=UPI001B8BFA5D|nr:integrase [Collimonas humicola]
MSDVVLFTPLAEKTAQENLDAFIGLCKSKLAVFGKDLPFDDVVWDITDTVQDRGKRSRKRIYFSSWDTVNDLDPKSMPEPFVSFAKAYVRYQHGLKPIIDQGARVAPLRAICTALDEIGKASPGDVDGHVLNRAAQLIEEKNSAERAYRLGRQLQSISEFLTGKRLVKTALSWKSHIKRPGDTQRVGKEFDDRRRERLPSAADLDAVAEAYRLAKEPGDVIITSIAAIMCSTPDRIAEILTLRADCEHHDRLPDGQEVYGLRYWPAKGADPMIKYLIPSMTDLVKDAIARIRQHTESSRALARWYEANPTRLYLPERLEHLRGVGLTLEQVSEIIFGVPELAQEAMTWLRYRGLRKPGVRLKDMWVPFADLEKAVLENLPHNFPYLDKGMGLKYSEVLCVVPLLTFHQRKRALFYGLESVTHGIMNDGLGGRVAHGVSSVFTRAGISGVDGEPVRLNTHKFRHYLNTLAMQGGLNDLDIAKWSGRKDVRQNRAYDHVSARDKLALIRDAIGDQSKMFGPLGHAPSVPSIKRDEFANLKVMNAHTTEFGYCTHDYASTPCQKYLDCLNCNELVCIKGDEVREANIRRQLEETRGLLVAARKGVEEGAYGADRWLQHQTQTLQRLDELSVILDNPMIQRGAVIQLKHLPSASRLSQAGQALGMDLSSTSDLPKGAALLASVGVYGSLFGDHE